MPDKILTALARERIKEWSQLTAFAARAHVSPNTVARWMADLSMQRKALTKVEAAFRRELEQQP
jgi:hypothetical protein